ncbi:hypothetical protein A4G19_15510 [Pasteurellaceae bacterium Macca]|nr:hypothetical protein [Pasteurellaceae bacterium Macca]MCK3657067.1 hypothetical protein [Pasteurellaceae bacterium Macca]
MDKFKKTLSSLSEIFDEAYSDKNKLIEIAKKQIEENKNPINKEYIIEILDETINNLRQSVDIYSKILNMLNVKAIANDDITDEINALKNLEFLLTPLIEINLNMMIRSQINRMVYISDELPTIERSIKAKKPKRKKPEQLKAEEYAKDIWGKDPTISQENMAYQLKDKLDLSQSIQTIIRWIRPHQPAK